MRDYKDAENAFIFLACNGLRLRLLNFQYEAYRCDQKFSDQKWITENFGKDSRIFTLMCQFKWFELFSNEEWLDLLKIAEKFNELLDRSLAKHIEIIAKYFPTEVLEVPGFRPTIGFMH